MLEILILYKSWFYMHSRSKVRFLKKKLYIFLQQGCIQLIKSDSIGICNVAKVFYFK